MKKFDATWIGLITGLIVPCIVIFFIYQSNEMMQAISSLEDFFINLRYTSVLLLPSLLANLAFFIVFMQFDFMKFCRGILFATILYGLFIVYFHIF
ncbi:MAG: putative membrane protein [Bacteroidia bacterium]|jgi:uncharacterized membrane protein